MSKSKKNKEQNANSEPQSTTGQTESTVVQPPSTEPISQTSAQVTPSTNRIYIALAALGLVILTFFCYKGAFDNDFVDWDDYAYVIDNELVRNNKVPTSEIFKQPISLNYHPLTIWSMRLNNNECKTCMEGISARPFIVGNVVLHILNVLFVLFIVLNLSGGQLVISFLAALWFGIHPLHVESVAWVSERKDVLYTFFFLIGMVTFLQFLKSEEKRWGWLFLTLLAFILSCLSKAMAVTFPLVLLLVVFWKDKSENGWESFRALFQPKRLMYIAPFFMVALFFGLMAVKIQSGGNFLGLLKIPVHNVAAVNEFGTFAPIERLHFASYGYTEYLLRFFYPHDLTTFYPYPFRKDYNADQAFWYLRLAFFIATIIGSFALLRRSKLFLFSFGFYFLTVALVLQFMSVGVVIMADRYTYLPYLGVAFLVLFPIGLLPKQIQLVAYGIAGLFSVFFMYKTIQQVETWKDSDALWTNVINTYKDQNIEQPYSIRGHFYGKKADKAFKAGNAELGKQFLAKAEQDFKSSIAKNTSRAEVFEGMGNIHGMRSEFQQALDNYSRAIALDSLKPSVYFNRGVTYSMLKDWNNAANDYFKALKMGADKQLELRTNLSIALIQAGRYQEGITELDWLVQNEPNNYAHYTNRGIAKSKLGDRAAALADLQKAIQLNPTDAFTQQQLQLLGQ